MSAFSVTADARQLYARFRALDEKAQAIVVKLTEQYTDELESELRAAIGKPVGKSRKGTKVRSKPGQPPRTDTGRTLAGIKRKVERKRTLNKAGGVGHVLSGSVTVSATDEKGRRYPWMLQAGTKTVKARPYARKIKRKVARKYGAAVGRAMIAAVRGSNR